MQYEKIINSITQDGKLPESVYPDVIRTIAQVYPVILLANLTRNTYVVVYDDGILFEKPPITGSYDELIEGGALRMYDKFNPLFLDTFSRQNLLARYENGVRVNSARMYMKIRGGEYHWVTMKAILLQDESGDVIQICLDEINPE